MIARSNFPVSFVGKSEIHSLASPVSTLDALKPKLRHHRILVPVVMADKGLKVKTLLEDWLNS